MTTKELILLGCVEKNYYINIVNGKNEVVDQIKGCSGKLKLNIEL